MSVSIALLRTLDFIKFSKLAILIFYFFVGEIPGELGD